MSIKKAPLTKGQKMAEKTRQRVNDASDEERERLMGVAMRMIYKSDQEKARAHRR